MKRSVVRKLLLLYPAKWRREYGAELEDLLLAEPLQPKVVLNVWWSALHQQARISNHPAGLIRSGARLTGGAGAIFVLSVLLSFPLWTLIVLPMAEALARSGRPPQLIQIQPWESFAIIWLGLPLLITTFLAYPVLLCLVRVKMASSWTPPRKRWATAFVISSGGMFLLSGVGGFVAWQYGRALTLQGFEPLAGLASITTVATCFGRFARSMLEMGILLQIPVFAFFLPRLKKSA